MPKLPTILMVAPTAGTFGGIETFTACIARQVLDSGEFDVRTVFRLRSGSELCPTLSSGLQTYGVPFRIMRGLDWKYIKDLLWADIVNCHFPLVYATYPARVLGKKLAISMENKREPKHGRRFHWGLQLAHARWYISKYVAGTWEVPRMSRVSLVVPAVASLPTQYVTPDERNGFLFTARWVPLKGLEQLIEAYALARIDHSLHPLTILGDGPLRNKIMALVQEFGISNYVDAPGFVSHEDKCQRMASARWNVAPAAFPEDLGLTPIEARACGVPSIVSDAGGLPEAGGQDALLCTPGDVGSLITCLETAASMSGADYSNRSNSCRSSLSDYLPAPEFYRDAFRRLGGI